MRLRLGGTFGGGSLAHGAEVARLAVAADDSVVVAADGGHPGRAVVWDLSTGEARLAVAARVYGLTCAAISHDGSRIAISGYDNQTVVLDAATGKRLKSFDTRAAAYAMAFSPGGEWLLVGDDRKPMLLPLGKGEPRALKGHLSRVNAAAVSPDGRHVVTAGGDRKVKLQDVAKAKVLATHAGHASMVAFVPDGSRFVFVGFDGAGIVEVPSGKLVRSLELGFVDTAALSGDGRRLAVKSGREPARVIVVELETGETVFDRTFEPIRHIALTHAGDRLVLARTAMLAQGTSLEVWSVADQERLLPKRAGHLGGVAAIASYGTAVTIAVSASADRTLKLWDVEAGSELESVEGGGDGLTALAVTPDGRIAVTASGYRRDSSLQRWDLAGMRVEGDLDVGELGAPRAVAISPDGRTAAASFVRRAALFELPTGRRRAVLEKHKAQVDAIAFSADGRFVVTGAADHLVKVWRAEDGTEVHALAEHTGFVHAVAALPDGSLVSASSELVRWDLASGTLLALVGGCGEVSTLAASPDGAWLVILRPFTRIVELWSLADQGIEGPVHRETVDDEPACAAFVGARAVLVGTKQGRIFRFDLEG